MVLDLYNYLVAHLKSGDNRTLIAKKNIVESLLIKGLSISTQLLMVPLTLHYVSSELYGIWLTLSSVIMWLSFFDVGLSLGLRNKLTEAIAIGDISSGKKYVSTTYFMMFAIFVPLCIILEIIIPFIDWPVLLNIDKEYNTEVIEVMQIIAACFCFQMIVHVLSSVASAYQKVALASFFPVIGQVLSLGVIFILTLTCPPSLFVLAMAISIVPIIVYVIYSLYYYNNDFKPIFPSIGCVDLKCINLLFGLGYKFFLIQIQLIVIFQTTNFLISNLSGPQEVTSYNIAYKYFSVGMMLYSIIISPFWPAFTDAYTKKDFIWMNSIYKKLCKIFVIIALIIGIMLLSSPLVYNFWIGDACIVPVSMSLVVAVYMLLQSWSSLQVQLINGIGSIGLQTIVTVLGMSIHIPVSLFVGSFLGGIGVVISMILINVIYCVLFTIQIRKLLQQKAYGIWSK